MPHINDSATRIVDGLWLIAKLKIVIAIIGGTEIRKNFMSGKLNSNNIKKDDFNVKTEDSIYKDLIVKLKEIKSTIALLEKTIFK